MTDYFLDGKVRARRFFKHDLQFGRTEFYYPNGKIKEIQYFENGLKQGGDTAFYENGKLQMILHFKDGKKHGYLKKWSPGDSLVFEAKYHLDTLVEVKGQPLR